MGMSAVEPPPEAFNFAAHLLGANAGRPGKTAFIDDAGAVTYGELDQRSRRFAAALKERGVKREERVLILMQDGADWPVAFLGAMLAGVVPVAVNTLLTADDLAYMLEHSRAQAAFVSGAVKPALKAALTKSDHEVHTVVVSRPAQPLDFGEIAFEDFLARAAPLRSRPHPRRRSRLLALFVRLDREAEGDGAFARQPLLDDRALRQGDPGAEGERRLLLGGQALLRLWARQRADLPARRRRDGAAHGRTADAGGGVQALAGRRRRSKADGLLWRADRLRRDARFHLSCRRAKEVALRLASSAGEALPAEIGERFKRHFGVDIVDGIGSTEMLHIFISNRPDKVRYGSTGWPVPGYEIELRGEDGRPTPDGEPGDLYIHGPSAALMYWGARAKTRETFEGRWTRSGDKYIRNADGSFTYAGRSDDMLKVGGIWVSPFEVEATLVQHPSVLEAAVIGAPDADGLIKTKAFVVLKEGASADEAELQRFVKDRLAPYKYPRAIAFIAELPKTATGKIQRFRLREQEAGGA